MHGIHATALAILGANKECGARRVRCFLLGTFKTCRDAPDVRLKGRVQPIAATHSANFSAGV